MQFREQGANVHSMAGAHRAVHAMLALAAFAATTSAWAVLPDIPGEVADFVDRRAQCDRFRSEKVDALNVARVKEVGAAIQQFCTGTDGQLQDLKKIYAGNQPVMTKLNEYDVKVEPVRK